MATGSMLPEDTFNILLATDIHLGYAETDPLRGDDSFNTFEEILAIAEQNKVDMILLGGDLFHHNKPSPKCMHKCMSLVRQYCMGDRPVSIEFLSDQSENFQHCLNPVVNYEDPNVNISIPIFSIHGNHDDPSGVGRVCSLDILSASGLVNYFGKWSDLKEVNISPLLLRKGATNLALYGLSHLPDDRLSRLFRGGMVNFFRPREDTDSWFNIFVLHQNRVNRGLNNYIEESMLPSFLDLVVWGHEHECLINPEWNSTEDFYITQPGSPVATSLCDGEAARKHVGILKINKKNFHLKPVALKTVRPFVIDSIQLSKSGIMAQRNVSEEVQKYVSAYVDTLIDRAAKQITGHVKQPEQPLIRLRVEYENELQAFNTVRFGERFQRKVANPGSLILARRERKAATKQEDVLDVETMQNLLTRDHPSMMWENRFESVLEEYFKTVSQVGLQVLSVKAMSQATSHFIDKDDKEAIQVLFDHEVKKLLQYMEEKKTSDDNVNEDVESFRALRASREDEDLKDVTAVLENKTRSQAYHAQLKTTASRNGDSEGISDIDSDDEMITVGDSSPRSRGRGAGRARASTRARSRGRGRGSTATAASPASTAQQRQRGARSRTLNL